MKVKVELGCGENKRIVDAIGVDILPLNGVDIVGDLNVGMPFFEDDSIDEIYSHHVLEHLMDFPNFMSEVYRVLKPGGLFYGEVPHFSNPYYFSDPTHKLFFGLYTFNYFVKDQSAFLRKVPSFYNSLDFEIIKYKLVFKSYSTENKIKTFFLKRLQGFFNKSIQRQELFEELFSKFFYCYELKFSIRKK